MKNDETRLEEMLRRRQQPPGEASPLCAGAEMLAAYAEGGLSGEARTRFESHLASCAHCQAAVVRLVRLAPAESAARPAAEPAHRPAPVFGFRWRWAIHALAGLVLVGSFAYYQRSRFAEITQEARTAVHRSAPQAATDEAAPAERDRGVTAPGSADKRAAEPAAPAESAAARPSEVRGAAEEKGGQVAAKLEQRAAGDTEKPKKAEAEAVSPLGKSMPGTRTGAASPAVAESAEPALRKDSHAGGVWGGIAPAAPAAAQPAPPRMARDRLGAAESQAAANASRPLSDANTANRQAAQTTLPAFNAQQARAGGPRTQSNQANIQQNQPSQALDQAKPPASAGNEVTLARRESVLQKEQAAEMAKRDGAAFSARGPAKTAETAQVELGFAPSPAPRGKVLNAGNRAFGVSGVQLMMKPDRAAGWEAAELPVTGRVLDFSIAGKSLWVLMSGGRVIHSPDLGTTWRAPVSTGLPDAASILFSSAASGEVRGPSGRRMTEDGGRTWTEPRD